MSQEPLHTEIYRTNAAPQALGPHFVRACGVEMHVNISREPLYTEIIGKYTGKNVAPQLGPRTRTHAHTHTHTLCVRLRSRNAWQHIWQHFTRAIFVSEIYRKNAAPQLAPRMRKHTHTHARAGAHTYFVRACAVEMHVSILQEPLHTEVCK